MQFTWIPMILGLFERRWTKIDWKFKLIVFENRKFPKKTFRRYANSKSRIFSFQRSFWSVRAFLFGECRLNRTKARPTSKLSQSSWGLHQTKFCCCDQSLFSHIYFHWFPLFRWLIFSVEENYKRPQYCHFTITNSEEKAIAFRLRTRVSYLTGCLFYFAQFRTETFHNSVTAMDFWNLFKALKSMS
jgi:hypothetical protein